MIQKCKTGDIGYLGVSDTFHIARHHEIGPTVKFQSQWVKCPEIKPIIVSLPMIYNVKKPVILTDIFEEIENSGFVTHKSFTSSTTSRKPINHILNRLAVIWKARWGVLKNKRPNFE